MDGGREATSDISMEVEKKTYYMAKIQWVTGGKNPTPVVSPVCVIGFGGPPCMDIDDMKW